MNTVANCARRSNTLPWSIAILTTVFLIQAQSTCISENALTGADAGTTGTTVLNQTGRELTGEELDQLISNTDGERIVVVFLNPNPGPQGEPGPQGLPGTTGPVGPAGPAGKAGLDAATPFLFPIIGEVRMWAGSYNSIPPGWLACDGRAIDPATYPELFQAVAYRWGSAANGAFLVPDFRDRSPMGASGEVATGAPATTVTGNQTTFGGAATHVLTAQEMPIHNHDMAHTHDVVVGPASSGSSAISDIQTPSPFNKATGPASRQNTGDAGGSQPHPILDPYFAISYIIFAGR